MIHKHNTLALDFGTSNSAAGALIDGKPRAILIEDGHTTMPTSVFYSPSDKRMLFGREANAALIEGAEGRFMRSLKSVLGTPLLREKRRMMGNTTSLLEIIAQFIMEVKSRSENQTGLVFDKALSGRPVHFHSANPARDQQALADLTECYHLAGFADVSFMHEPEAAALSSNTDESPDYVGLIVDIGGGTSDFSLFRKHQHSAQGIEILASHGVRVGGTNFDQSISVDHVMPLLGRGAKIRKEMGPGLHTAPNALFQELATWEKIPFLYTAETRRDVARLQKLAEEPQLFSRLGSLLEHEMGHDVAFAVERGKIEINTRGQGQASIDLGIVEKSLQAHISPDDLTHSLRTHTSKIQECALETLNMAGLKGRKPDVVIPVGGASLMASVSQVIADILPDARVHSSNAFTAVVDGLTLASAKN